jgi:hypothetical protein
MDRYIEVRTQVPERLLPRYHELVAKLLREGLASEKSAAEPVRERHGMQRPWTEPEIPRDIIFQPVDGGDIDGVMTPSYESVPSATHDASNLYMLLSPRALETFQYVVDRPGQRISGDELAQALGVSPSELTGSLSSMRKRIDAMKSNRPMPLRYRSGPNGGTYSIDRDVADMFRKVLDDWMRFGWPDDEGWEDYGELVGNTLSLLDLFPARQAAREKLRLLEEASADEAHRQEFQRKIDRLDERYGQLAKKRAGLLRKYDPQAVEELGLGEKLHAEQTPAAARRELQMT